MRDRILFYRSTDGGGTIGSFDGMTIKNEQTITAGSFATNWTQIAGLSGNRILYYSRSPGRVLIGSIDASNHLTDVVALPAGFAQDWTQITGLSGDRILFYSPSGASGFDGGRVVIDSISTDNKLTQLALVTEFEQDWTQITGLSGDRILYYSASDGRILIGAIDAENFLSDVTAVPTADLPPGGPWSLITQVGKVILFYNRATGGGRFVSIDDENRLTDALIIPAGTLGQNWTQSPWVGF